MKQIINGKKFDTETAEKVDYNSNTNNRTDFRYASETLYKKKNDTFFIEIENYGLGTNSIFDREDVEKLHSSITNRNSIIPLNHDQTKKWLEKNSTAEIYEKLFGIVEE